MALERGFLCHRRHGHRRQGHHRDRGHADRPGLSHVGGISYPPRCGLRSGPARGGRDHSRQDDHHGVCRDRASHAGTQPARSCAHGGGIEQRVGRGGRRRHPAGGARDAGGRLDPAAGELLRLRGIQAHLRRAQPQRIVRSPQPELPRDPGGHPRGRLDGGERDRGARRGRSRKSRAARAGRHAADVTTTPARGARDSRVAEGERWCTGSTRAGARAPRRAWCRDRRPPQRSIHLSGRGRDCRCGRGDLCDLRLGVSLAFGKLRQAQRLERRHAPAPCLRATDDPRRLSHRASPPGGDSQALRRRERTVRRICHLGCDRGGACRAHLDRRSRLQRTGLAPWRSRDLAAVPARRAHAARPADHRPCR